MTAAKLILIDLFWDLDWFHWIGADVQSTSCTPGSCGTAYRLKGSLMSPYSLSPLVSIAVYLHSVISYLCINIINNIVIDFFVNISICQNIYRQNDRLPAICPLKSI